MNLKLVEHCLLYLMDAEGRWQFGYLNLLETLASYIFWFSSVVFDNLLHIGLSTNLMKSEFVTAAWSNIRDLANMTFVLGAIAIAFMMIFSKDEKYKSYIINLIIIAFVLNFSLFFSKIIVDAGNITSHVFLNVSSVKVIEKEESILPSHFFIAKAITGNDNINRSVGAALVKGLSTKNLFGAKNFEDWKEIDKSADQVMTYFFMNLLVGFVYFAIAKKFFSAGFMFLGRLVWIVFYMVTSPIYFISYFIPGQEERLKNDWFFPLLQKSFCIVVYLFFIWLSYIILSSGVTEVGEGGFYTLLFVFIIKAIFITVLLDKAGSIGNKFCENGKSTLGEIAEGAGSLLKLTPIGKVMGTAIGSLGLKIQNSKIIKKCRFRTNTIWRSCWRACI